MDRRGRDLLAALSDSTDPSQSRSSVERDIADCFGAAGGTASASARQDDKPVDGFGRARGSL